MHRFILCSDRCTWNAVLRIRWVFQWLCAVWILDVHIGWWHAYSSVTLWFRWSLKVGRGFTVNKANAYFDTVIALSLLCPVAVSSLYWWWQMRWVVMWCACLLPSCCWYGLYCLVLETVECNTWRRGTWQPSFLRSPCWICFSDLVHS